MRKKDKVTLVIVDQKGEKILEFKNATIVKQKDSRSFKNRFISKLKNIIRRLLHIYKTK